MFLLKHRFDLSLLKLKVNLEFEQNCLLKKWQSLICLTNNGVVTNDVIDEKEHANLRPFWRKNVGTHKMFGISFEISNIRVHFTQYGKSRNLPSLKIFCENRSLVSYSGKTLFSRNIFQKSVRVNFRNFHTVNYFLVKIFLHDIFLFNLALFCVLSCSCIIVFFLYSVSSAHSI